MRTKHVRIRNPKGGPDIARDVGHPSFLAFVCYREGSVVRFQYLNVDEQISAGEEECLLLTEPSITPSRILIRWPGLEPGLYPANGLRIIGDHSDEAAES